MVEETKNLVSEEEAIKELDMMESSVEEKKKEDKKKHKKEKKEKKPKEKSGNTTKKIILSGLIISLIILAIAFGFYFIRLYLERQNLEKLNSKVEKLVGKYYEEVDKTTFEGNAMTIQTGKYTSDKFIKLDEEEMPVLATIKVDVDGLVSYAIATDNFCAVKNAYDKKASINNNDYTNCKLDVTADDYIIKNNKELVKDDEKTGYVEDLAYASKYYFEGANPNNYIVLANRCFRIVNIANNGNIKAIYDGYYNENGCELTSNGYAMIVRTAFDKNTNNYYNEETTIRTLIDGYIKDKNVNDKIDLSDDMDKLANATWYVGAVNTTSNLKGIVSSERTSKGNSALTNQEKYYSITSKIGLANVSDFIKASSSETCVGMSSAYSNPNYECKNDNYLALEGYPTWSMNAYNDANNRTWRITGLGSLIPNLVSNDGAYIRPVVYIKGNVLITGNGTTKDPYIVK